METANNKVEKTGKTSAWLTSRHDSGVLRDYNKPRKTLSHTTNWNWMTTFTSEETNHTVQGKSLSWYVDKQKIPKAYGFTEFQKHKQICCWLQQLTLKTLN